VVPHFAEQIRRGGPVTVTHPDVKRFFMLIPEAVGLVLHAAAQAHSGGTYVLNMGEQIRIVDLATNMIRQAGKVPGEDIEIVFTGLRAGEKLEEELISRDERLIPSNISDVSFVVRPPASPTLQHDVDAIEERAVAGDERAVVMALMGLAVAGPQDQLAHPVPQRAGAVPEEAAVQASPCPRCATGELKRSRARTTFERLRRMTTDKRLYRCDHCGHRVWLTPMEPVVILRREPPRLTCRAWMRRRWPGPGSGRPTFAPRDL
jgi:hypothetical protein